LPRVKSQATAKVNMDSRERASQASAILNNEVFQYAVKQLEHDLISQWTIAEDTSLREECWLRLNALGSIKGSLEALIHNHKIENS
jgi:hypothetical protein